jgi:NADPH2:quinone reductase
VSAPRLMRAQQLQSLDGPAGLHLVNLEAPVRQDQVLIDVKASGVSFPELLFTYGRYQVRPELPFVPGVEVAGTVLRAPADSGFAVGDRVCAFTHFGGWAEQAEAAVNLTFRLNPALDLAGGAALVMNYQTAYHCLAVRGRTQAGEWVVVHGAAGGLGTAGIQVAIGLGARVIAVVSTEAKAEVARAAGAEQVIIFADDWLREAREMTAGQGADVVFDVVGGPRFLDSLRSLAPGGRFVVVGFADGEIPQVKTNRLLMTNTEVIGAAWGHWTECFPDSALPAGEAIDAMVDAGVVRPVVGHRFGLTEIDEALRTLERRDAIGKVILEL